MFYHTNLFENFVNVGWLRSNLSKITLILPKSIYSQPHKRCTHVWCKYLEDSTTTSKIWAYLSRVTTSHTMTLQRITCRRECCNLDAGLVGHVSNWPALQRRILRKNVIFFASDNPLHYFLPTVMLQIKQQVAHKLVRTPNSWPLHLCRFVSSLRTSFLRAILESSRHPS